MESMPVRLSEPTFVLSSAFGAKSQPLRRRDTAGHDAGAQISDLAADTSEVIFELSDALGREKRAEKGE
jgi:hypothetical protein